MIDMDRATKVDRDVFLMTLPPESNVAIGRTRRCRVAEELEPVVSF
jgi:hypothetical protein